MQSFSTSPNTDQACIDFFPPICAYLWFCRAEFPEGAPFTWGPCSSRRLFLNRTSSLMPFRTLLCLQQPLARWTMYREVIRGLAMSALSLQQAHCSLQSLNCINCLHLASITHSCEKQRKKPAFGMGMTEDEMSRRAETRVS